MAMYLALKVDVETVYYCLLYQMTMFFPKKKAVPSNRLYIIDVFGITTVCIFYHTKFVLLSLQLITYRILTLFYTKCDCFFQVLKDLFGNSEVFYLWI